MLFDVINSYILILLKVSLYRFLDLGLLLDEILRKISHYKTQFKNGLKLFFVIEFRVQNLIDYVIILNRAYLFF